jgi:hypothetical protein
VPQGIFSRNVAAQAVGLLEAVVQWHQPGHANSVAILRAERMGGRGLQMAGIRRSARRFVIGLWNADRWNSETVWKYLDKRS